MNIEYLIERTATQLAEVIRGGPGSGHHGHVGRLGEVGGSLPSGAVAFKDRANAVSEYLNDHGTNLQPWKIKGQSAIWITPDGDILDFRFNHWQPAHDALLSIKVTEGQIIKELGLPISMIGSGEAVIFEMLQLGFLRMRAWGYDKTLNIQVKRPITYSQKRTLRDIYASRPDYEVTFDIEPLKHYTGQKMIQGVKDKRTFNRLMGIVERGGLGSGHHGHKGRPGEVGGSLPIGKAAMKLSELEGKFPVELIKEDGNKIRKSENEQGFYYTDEGKRGRNFGGNRTEGISVPPYVKAELDLLESKGVDVSLTHNHPSGAPFSPGDMLFAVRHGVEEMRITHPWKKWPDYIVRINTEEIELDSVKKLVLPFFNNHQEDTYNNIQSELSIQERHTDRSIHETQVESMRETWKMVEYHWPNWFNYIEVER